MELCLVLLYCSSIFGSTLRYWVLPWTVNCFHILVLIVRFHLSQTLDFSSFLVEYSVMLSFFNSSLTLCVCYNTLAPYQSTDIAGLRPSLKMVLNASVTISPFSSFNAGTDNPAIFGEQVYYHEKISITLVPFTELLQFNQIRASDFVDTVYNNTPPSKITLYGCM